MKSASVASGGQVAVLRGNGLVGSFAVVLVDAGRANDEHAPWLRILATGLTRQTSEEFAARYNSNGGAR